MPEGRLTPTARAAAVDALCKIARNEARYTARDAWALAEVELGRAIDRLVRAGVENEPAALERVAELREARDEAQRAHERASDADASMRVAVTAGDLDLLTVAEWRDLIRAVIEHVEIRRGGRGAERVTIKARIL